MPLARKRGRDGRFRKGDFAECAGKPESVEPPDAERDHPGMPSAKARPSRGLLDELDGQERDRERDDRLKRGLGDSHEPEGSQGQRDAVSDREGRDGSDQPTPPRWAGAFSMRVSESPISPYWAWKGTSANCRLTGYNPDGNPLTHGPRLRP